LAGWHFRRQHVCGRFILDLYCTQAKLAVEIDGDTHAHTAQKARDDERARCLAARGIRVLRFWNDEVLTQTDTVLELLSRTLADRTPLPIPLPASGERGVQQLPRPGTGEE
jgi:very-short-patch-repair endonuclease